ncbi:type 1 fimbrial protein [Paraburkholderia edwinii]|uniref:Type 1 fimbrial protein n=1 Tax=Paraburkholderia edwinii TaxID=2861782 RepID=A0ABX8UTW4_9BURK|nr:fimbrial protein [Paraburkholderia edwinii]QYD72450.1 type 1 fimbrial protein [Paraburkholderia edwinii]
MTNLAKWQGEMFRLKMLVQIVRTTSFLLLSQSACANIVCEVASVNKVLNAGTVSVAVNAAAGSTVLLLAPDPFQLTCSFPDSGSVRDTSAILYSDFKTTAPLAAGFTDVYQTEIAGVGTRYTFNSPQCNAVNIVLANNSVRINCPFSGPLGGPIQAANVSVTVAFVVTGVIASGASNFSKAPAVTIGFATSDGGTGYWNKSPLYTGSASGVFTHATCSVSEAQVAVILPTADTGAFRSGTGAVAAPQPFTLSFSCNTGAKVLITLTDSVNPSNRTTTLQTTADSTAKGIGVQILNSAGAPLSFGPDSAAPGNLNQWTVGDSPSGTLKVPLTARYVRTGVVSAGTVKALATFTMSYQ